MLARGRVALRMLWGTRETFSILIAIVVLQLQNMTRLIELRTSGQDGLIRTRSTLLP